MKFLVDNAVLPKVAEVPKAQWLYLVKVLDLWIQKALLECLVWPGAT